MYILFKIFNFIFLYTFYIKMCHTIIALITHNSKYFVKFSTFIFLYYIILYYSFLYITSNIFYIFYRILRLDNKYTD